MMLAFLAGIAVCLAGAFAFDKYRTAQRQQTARAIADHVVAYFAKGGVEVDAACYSDDGKRFFIHIQSEPLKKFRLSYIIEQTLITHIFKVSGKRVAAVYWRFPVPPKEEVVAAVPAAAPEAAPLPAKTAAAGDAYLAQGYAQRQAESDYEVGEVSWDNYETALHSPAKEGGKTKTG